MPARDAIAAIRRRSPKPNVGEGEGKVAANVLSA